MKNYLDLIPISAKTHRKQNRLTLGCIILAVFLVTSMFSIADIWTAAEERTMVRRHGSHHIILSGISEEEARQIAGQDNVAVAVRHLTMGESKEWVDKGYRIGDKRVVLYGTDKDYVYEIRDYEHEGAYPRNDTEIMLSADAKEQLGLHVGDDIAIHTPSGDFAYTISGFCMDDTEYNAGINGICAYMDAGVVEKLGAANQEKGEENYYIQFKKDTNLKKAIADLKAEYHLSSENVKENIATLGMAGASSKEGINGLYATAAVLFCLVLLASVLVISSCMNSNVAQRTKFFGMMRCIGASKKQVIRFVRLEALNWCKTAVPAGCGLGIAATGIACVILRKLVGGEFAEFSFKISVIGIVSGTLVGVATVLLAAHAPAKRAAAVSPMAAVSGNAGTKKKISHAANTRMFKVETALGAYHAAAEKKNLILISLSFALTVTLFLTLFACSDFVRKLLPSTSNFILDVAITSTDNTNAIPRSLKEEIAALPGVKEVFSNAYALDTPAHINGAGGSVDLISYDEYMFDLSRKSVVSGDLSKITADSDYALTIFNGSSRVNVGDKIRIGDTELEIACVVSEGIGTDGERPLVICREETFRRITGEDNYLLLNAKLEKDAEEETVSAIQKLAEGFEFADRREEKKTSYSGFFVFRVAAYSFLTIVSLITILNIMNNISMSVSARMKQYGAMRAVGMSTGQMTKMIAAEAATYVLCGLVIGCAAGLYLHRLFTIKLIVSHFGGAWTVPVEGLAMIILLVVVSGIAAVYTPAKRMKEMSITETINEFM